MQFTPQQLAGAQRYGSNTRIGNWLEDCKLKETKIAEFCEAKEYVRRRGVFVPSAGALHASQLTNSNHFLL